MSIVFVPETQLVSQIKYEEQFKVGDLVMTKQYYLFSLDEGRNGIGIVTDTFTEDVSTFDHEGMKTTTKPVNYVNVVWAGTESNLPDKVPAHMVYVVHRDEQ